MARLALDFGTSNTAAGLVVAGRPQVLPLEAGADTLPSAVFVDFAERKYLYGRAAATAMMDGQEGRFLRALKSVLGTALMREERRFLNEKLTLVQVVARFLAEIRQRAERASGQRFDAVLSGRPVRFHSSDAARDAQAQVDLAEAYRLAGFEQVAFLPEPEAAALAVQGTGRMLIVDIGGGTSDFTLCDRVNAQTQVIHSRGLRLGGTDFDKALSLSHVMPLLGYGAQIGSELGSRTHTAPRGVFQDLASWEKIAFVYDAALLREVRRWARLAPDAAPFDRLAEVLEAHLGHDIAYAVEAGKIGANGAEAGEITLSVVERGLVVPLTHKTLQLGLGGFADQIAAAALDTLRDAAVAPDSVDQVVYVGGSSLLASVRAAMAQALPDAQPVESEVFTAVVHGLALAAQ